MFLKIYYIFNSMILTRLKTNERARVIAIEGGEQVKQALYLRGLSEGGVFRMISGERGPVLIEIKGSTLAIGRGMAKKIRVTKV